MLAAPATTEPPAPAAPAAIVAYHDSGAWARDAGTVTERARRFLERHHGRRAAMVLDVDDTALSTYACLRAVGFVRADGDCAGGGALPPVEQTLGLFRRAVGSGVTVFFVTRRRESLRAVTRRNLRAAGYGGRLRVRPAPNGGTKAAHRAFKARERARIRRAGWRIVANVGDQRSDLTGGSARRTFKLPNPMYVTR
jgi:HAD superfamily, subfamily IIIB (Acid phosphatase)